MRAVHGVPVEQGPEARADRALRQARNVEVRKMPIPSEQPLQSRYRWVIVAASAAMLALAMGQLVNGMSAFFDPLEAELGWSRAEIALINTAGLIGLGLGGIVMGLVADRVRIRIVTLTGAIVTGACTIAAARSNSLAEFYVIFFLAGAFGGGALFAPLFALVGGWFRTGAGLAIGIVAAGQAVGQGGVPLLNTILIQAFGWREAFVVSGCAALAVLVPLALLLKEPPRAPGHVASRASRAEPSVSLAVSIPLLSAATLFCCSLMSVPLMHLMPLIQTCGIAAPDAGGALFVMMLSAIAGRLAFGKFADRVGAVRAYFVASAWQTLLVFGFTMLGDVGDFYVFAPVYGFGYGGVMTCVLTTIGVLAPVDRRSGATGIVLAFAWAGHGLGGLLGGVFFDLTLSYELAFLAAAIAGCVNLTILAALWRLSSGKDRGRAELPVLAAEPVRA
jgi:MFS family permease